IDSLATRLPRFPKQNDASYQDDHGEAEPLDGIGEMWAVVERGRGPADRADPEGLPGGRRPTGGQGDGACRVGEQLDYEGKHPVGKRIPEGPRTHLAAAPPRPPAPPPGVRGVRPPGRPPRHV